MHSGIGPIRDQMQSEENTMIILEHYLIQQIMSPYIVEFDSSISIVIGVVASCILINVQRHSVLELKRAAPVTRLLDLTPRCVGRGQEINTPCRG